VTIVAAKTKWFELENYSFDAYVKEFGKTYSAVEFAQRRVTFEQRLESIKRNNRDTTRSWKEGVNHMTDRTDEEFSKLLGYKKELGYRSVSSRAPPKERKIDISALPTSVDWREKGIITSVKDQGRCGSCWSFGTAETVESYYALATGLLTDLSEQQILDCTANTNDCGGTGGCGGGTPEIAYQQIIAMGGLASEWTYPYVSWSGSNFKCQNASLNPVAVLSGYKVLTSNTLAPVLDALANVGPLAINVDASAWSSYESGVFDGCNQKNPDIDHVVQLVGYGTDAQFGDYWLVRNSWTPSWGEDGYIRLRRTSTPRCGIDLTPSDGTGCNGGPPQVTVCGTCGILYDVSYPVIQQ